VANLLDKQIIEEGPRNAVVKLTGVLKDSDVPYGQLGVDLSDFINNDTGVRLTGLRVDAIIYALGPSLNAVLAWNGNSPQTIAPLARSGKLDATGDGGFLPDQNRSGFNGGIGMSTSGFPPGSTQDFTIFLRLIKLYKV
jgi:hypothetical protein